MFTRIKERKGFSVRDEWVYFILMLFPLLTAAFFSYQIVEFSIIRPVIFMLLTAAMLYFVVKNKYINIPNAVLTLIYLVFIALGSKLNIGITLQYVPFFILLWMTDPKLSGSFSLLRFFEYAAIFSAVGILFQFALPSVFLKTVIPQFSGYSQIDKLMKQFNQGENLTGFIYEAAISAKYIVWGIAFMVIEMALDRSKRKPLRMVILALMIFALFLTGRRTYVGFGVIAAAVTFYFASPKDKRNKRLLILFGCGIAGLVLLPIVAKLTQMTALVRLSDTLMGVLKGESLFGYRGTLFDKAIEQFKQNPIFGIGWKQFRTMNVNLAGYELDVHNVYLQLLCETGVVGLTLFVAFFIKYLVKAIKLCRIQLDNKERITVYFLLFVQLFFLLSSVSENELYYLTSFAYYFLSCAFVQSLYRKYIKSDKDLNRKIRI